VINKIDEYLNTPEKKPKYRIVHPTFSIPFFDAKLLKRMLSFIEILNIRFVTIKSLSKL